MLDIHDQAVAALTDNPWDFCDFLLASSHLVKRKERVAELIKAKPWDLVLVDEAHHARRRDFKQPVYRPNRLLTLLNELRDKQKFQSIVLMTATPMQVHPVEVWDLLRVLGLGGRWGADEANFLGFFSELRQPYDSVDWNFVYGMVKDYLGISEKIDTNVAKALEERLGLVHAQAILELPFQLTDRKSVLRSLPKVAQTSVYEMARHHTPLRRYIFRNTRSLLRKYVEKGILKARIARRKPEICRIQFRSDEETLYNRVTEYISDFYQRYEQERTGLGFIMTIYRRRLTSSFFALRISLERRRRWLLGQLRSPDEVFSSEDLAEADELDELEQTGLEAQDLAELTPKQKQNFKQELVYLEDFINELNTLSINDSKLSYLKDALAQVFQLRDTIIVFTQYTDTMDYVREQLREVYGTSVACYSGRGGEIWNGIAWVQTSKEHVKTSFRKDEIRILLCTESASEGLNLQTCGVLINYDMPWNPMRVEQRIGRIDRIDQKYEEVWIYNYFYKESIEDRIYQALVDRINWFEDVVGELQPILAKVGEMTRQLAMLPAEQQGAAFDKEIRQLRAAIQTAQFDALNLDQFLEFEEPDSKLQSPVKLPDLERILTQSQAAKHLFKHHPEIPDAYLLAQGSETTAVTFLPKCFDEHPDTVQFLTYGNPLLHEILNGVPAPEVYPLQLQRHATTDDILIRAWYLLQATKLTDVTSVSQLQRFLSSTSTTPTILGSQTNSIQQHFEKQVKDSLGQIQARREYHIQQRQATLKAQAYRLLEKAAIVEIALGQQSDLFAIDTYPTEFNENAVKGLKRHNSPWSWMIRIASAPLPVPLLTDLYYEQIRNYPKDKLQELFQQLTGEAMSVRNAWRSEIT